MKNRLIILITFIIISLSSSVIISPAFSSVLLQRVNFKVVGDIMVHDVQYRSAHDWQTGNYDFLPMFEQIKENLAADVLVGNLETTLSGPKLGYSGYPRFNSPDNLAETLSKLGFDMLFTANNHSLDKGEFGLRRTIEIVEQNNISHTGTFLSEEDREKPRIIAAQGISFGFLNYTYGTNGIKAPEGKDYLVNYINLEKITEDITKLRPLVDMVVVGIHFGNEYWQSPSDEQRYLSSEIAKAGADIILGGHPHVLQPFEFIDVDGERECFVVYSLGNFVSGQKQRFTDSGAILELVIEKSILDNRPQIVKVDYTPIWVRRYVNLGRLRMEVVPVKEDIPLKVVLSSTELKKAAEVENDVKAIWQPLVYDNSFNSILSVWANNFLPITDPKWWLPTLINLK